MQIVKNNLQSSFSIKATDIVELLRQRTDEQPDSIAYTFLADGEDEFDSITYRALENKTKSIASRLQSMNMQGERALLLYPPGLDYIVAFFGCLYAGVLAVPAYPPRKNKSLSRLEAIIHDAEAKVALTVTQIQSDIEKKFNEGGKGQSISWLSTDSEDFDLQTGWDKPDIGPESIAFLQYTSGSTGNPKGVMVTHQNLLENLKDLDLGLEHDSDSIMVSWLPVFHDMGLIYGILMPLYKGFPCYFMSPASFLEKPFRWLRAISKYKGTHTAAPNFAFDLCASKVSKEQRDSLDLSSWKATINGAEPVRAETIERFYEVFKLNNLKESTNCPGYGLAETTLKVSTSRIDSKPYIIDLQGDAFEKNLIVTAKTDDKNIKRLVGCGWTDIDTIIYIVEPNTFKCCGPDQVGEIWIKGPTVAKGYWNREEETEKTFRAYTSDTNEGPFLRTGDLGFVKDKELFITGRLKDLIIIRGANHYPHDIEFTAENSHLSLRKGLSAAFTIEVGDQEKLVLALEVERTALRNFQIEEVSKAVREAVFDIHDIPVAAIIFLQTGTIPKTSSGKIQRKTCKNEFLAGTLTLTGKWISPLTGVQDPFAATPPEEKVLIKSVQIKETVKSISVWLIKWIAGSQNISENALNDQVSFNECGLDSATSVALSSDIKEWLGISLEETLVWNYPTIGALADFLFTLKNEKPTNTIQKKEIHEPGNRVLELIIGSEEEAAHLLKLEMDKISKLMMS